MSQNSSLQKRKTNYATGKLVKIYIEHFLASIVDLLIYLEKITRKEFFLRVIFVFEFDLWKNCKEIMYVRLNVLYIVCEKLLIGIIGF